MKQLWFAPLFFFSCEQPSRFAPLAIETSKPSRSLPVEQWLSTSQPTGPLPEVSAPSLTCVKVDANGETLMPPLIGGQSLDAYKDTLACLVIIQSDEYTQARAQLRAGEEIAVVEEVLFGDAPSKKYLFWIAGASWREFVGEKRRFSVEVVFPCEAPDEDDGMGCELVLAQSFSASPVAAESVTEPKSVKGMAPKVSEPQCAAADSAGLWGEPLMVDGAITPSFFCKLTVENPGENKLENVTLQLRGGASKTAFKVLGSQLYQELAPKERRSYLFQASSEATGNTFVITAAAGRTAVERNTSQKILSLKVKAPATSAPTSQP